MLNDDKKPAKIVTVVFDTFQDLLWLGFEHGFVRSYHHSPAIQASQGHYQPWRLYTSFRCMATNRGPLKQILLNDKGVLVLGCGNLHMRNRRGIVLWNFPGRQRHPNMEKMQCMTFTFKEPGHVLVAGDDPSMISLNIQRSEQVTVLSEHPTHDKYVFIKATTRWVVGATSAGKVNILHPDSMEVVQSFEPYMDKISDLAVNSDYVIACGYFIREHYPYKLDGMLGVYDLRQLALINPQNFPHGPRYIVPHPNKVTAFFVLSQHGQIQRVDLEDDQRTVVKQTNVEHSPSGLAVSPSMEAAAVIDEDRSKIHIWASPTQPLRFVSSAQPIELPAAPTHAPSRLSDYNPLNDRDCPPFNLVGSPYYKEELFSTWPNMWHTIGRPHAVFDSQFLASLTSIKASYRYGANSRGLRANQIEPSQQITAPESREESKYLSQPERDDTEKKDPWRALSIKFSRFGFADFDFAYFNKTRYSGLTNHQHHEEVYVNALLQLLRFTPVIRNLALSHLSGNCTEEECFLCEIGFLFDMMEKAEGAVCQARNLLRTLAHDENAKKWFPPQKEDIGSRLQRLARFLMDRIVDEFGNNCTGPNSMDKALSIKATNRQVCANCKARNFREGTSTVTDLMYPSQSRLIFSQVLKSSIEREIQSKGWCAECKRYLQISNRKTVHALPDVFVLNTAANDSRKKQLWTTKGWLPTEIAIICKDNQLYCYEGDDVKVHLERNVHAVQVYSLVGVAINIDKIKNDEPAHLVAAVNVGLSSPRNSQASISEWMLMNDFLVQPISASEALHFSDTKSPVVVVYQAQQRNHDIDNRWKDSIDTTLLFTDDYPGQEKPYRILDRTVEMPSAGTLIALDSEFVKVGSEGIQLETLKENGKYITPSPKTVARVSVIRETGEPFIDDWISPKEEVADYLTAWSGITKEDLEPGTSSRHLVPLKVAIKKLWLLLNLGCKFIGHSLDNDFRELNIFVPSAQRIDTVQLFQTPGYKRQISLSFLCWCVLKERIQQNTHDSIEDAMTALKLYKKYVEASNEGKLSSLISHIYSVGQQYGFRVGWDESATSSQSIFGAASGRVTPPQQGAGAALYPPATPVRYPGGLMSSGSTPGTPFSSGRGSSPMP